jgi:hypothetical protein
MKGDFATPPIVIIFFTLCAHKIPAVVDLSAGPNDRYARLFRYAEIVLLLVREMAPPLNR